MSDEIRGVRLAHGIEINSFIERGEAAWRITVPSWLPAGWLPQAKFVSLDAALTALRETGTLDAIDTLWQATMEKQRARRAYLSKAMAVYTRTRTP